MYFLPAFYPWSSGQASMTAHTIDTTQKALGIGITFPRSGTLQRVGFLTGSVTVAATINVRLETLASLVPSGTLYAANATGSQAAPTANTWYRPQINGATGIAVVAGERASVTFDCPSGSPNLGIQRSWTGTSAPGSFMTYATRATTTWAYGNSTIAPLVLEYADGVPWIGGLPYQANPSSNGLQATTTPDEAGLSITIPFSGRCIGCWAVTSGTGFERFRIYAGTTQLATTQDYPQNQWTNYGTPRNYLWTTPVELSAGSTYVVSLIPHAGATNATLYRGVLNQSSYASALGLTVGDGLLTRTDGGAWSAVDSVTIPMMGLIFDQITASSVGRGRPPLYGV
jgi:hypothetical protein